MIKVFIDTDIILDLLMKREPHYVYSSILFSLIEKKQIKGYFSSLIFSNLFYILKKSASREKAKDSLKKLSLLVEILPVDSEIIELALLSDFNDFEDSIQYYTALKNGINLLLTRNKKDYKDSVISIYTAEEYIKIFTKK